MSAPTASVQDRGADRSWDSPGGLGIEERRNFAAWHVAVACGATLVIGMIIGFSGKKTSSPHPQTSGSFSTSRPSSSPSISAQVAPGTVPTTVATTSAPPAAPTGGAEVVLVNAVTSAGPQDLQQFTSGGEYKVGWAFSCVGAPAGAGTFTITAVDASGATAVVVNQTSRSGQGVTPEPAAPGPRHLHVATDPACRWRIKVTGIPG